MNHVLKKSSLKKVQQLNQNLIWISHIFILQFLSFQKTDFYKKNKHKYQAFQNRAWHFKRVNLPTFGVGKGLCLLPNICKLAILTK